MWLADRRSTCCRDGLYPAETDETNPTNRSSERGCFLSSFIVLTPTNRTKSTMPCSCGLFCLSCQFSFYCIAFIYGLLMKAKV
jgi:hypothetical protein